MEVTKKCKSRRELLRCVLRYGTLGLIGAAAGGTAVKRRRLYREGKCVNGGLCRDCRVFDGCGRPAALSAKKVLGSKSNG